MQLQDAISFINASLAPAVLATGSIYALRETTQYFVSPREEIENSTRIA